jgi:hypothetical protein
MTAPCSAASTREWPGPARRCPEPASSPGRRRRMAVRPGGRGWRWVSVMAVSLAANLAAAPALAWQAADRGHRLAAVCSRAVLLVEPPVHGQRRDERTETASPTAPRPTMACRPRLRPAAETRCRLRSRWVLDHRLTATRRRIAAWQHASPRRDAVSTRRSGKRRRPPPSRGRHLVAPTGAARGRIPAGAERDRVAGYQQLRTDSSGPCRRTSRLSAVDGERRLSVRVAPATPG